MPRTQLLTRSQIRERDGTLACVPKALLLLEQVNWFLEHAPQANDLFEQPFHLIAAARPNFMKVAPLWHVLAAAPKFRPALIHTGQHYDVNMSTAIFADLKLGAPDYNLGDGPGTHAEQTGKVMIAYERVALSERPDWLVVAGTSISRRLVPRWGDARGNKPTRH